MEAVEFEQLTYDNTQDVEHDGVVVSQSSASFFLQSNSEIQERLRPRNKEMTPSHFEPMQVLGRGSFGEVYLVRKKSNGQLYAMKVMAKEQIVKNNLVKYARTERNVLSYVQHNFIVKLQYAF